MIHSKKLDLEKKWLNRHILSPDQRKKLIEDKIDRAIEQSKRLYKTIEII